MTASDTCTVRYMTSCTHGHPHMRRRAVLALLASAAMPPPLAATAAGEPGVTATTRAVGIGPVYENRSPKGAA